MAPAVADRLRALDRRVLGPERPVTARTHGAVAALGLGLVLAAAVLGALVEGPFWGGLLGGGAGAAAGAGVRWVRAERPPGDRGRWLAAAGASLTALVLGVTASLLVEPELTRDRCRQVLAELDRGEVSLSRVEDLAECRRRGLS